MWIKKVIKRRYLFDKINDDFMYRKEVIDGVTYDVMIPPYTWINQLSYFIQIALDKIGIKTHGIFAGECLPDFSCCMHKLSEEDKEIMQMIADACNESG